MAGARLRGAVAVLFVGGQAAAVLAGGFEPDQEVAALTFAVCVPFACGLVVARWWAAVLALTPIALYAIDPSVTGDLGVGFALGASVLLNVICLSAGVTVGRLLGLGPPNALDSAG